MTASAQGRCDRGDSALHDERPARLPVHHAQWGGVSAGDQLHTADRGGAAVVGDQGRAILAFILNIYSVTYSPVPSLDKPVGFFWAPNWTLLVVLLLPLFLTILNELLTFWVNDGRSKLGGVEDDQGWDQIVASFSPVFWAVFLICFGIVFLTPILDKGLLRGIHEPTFL